MRPKTAKWIDDIRSSASFILGAVEGKRLVDYEADPLLRAAVERHLEIIGEAVGRVARHDPGTAARISDHTRIVAFRNVLIHGYDLVDHAAIWDVIREGLPKLLREAEGLLREVGDGGPETGAG